MKKILTIGGATRDIFIQYEHPEMLHLHTATEERSFLILEEGRKIEVSNLAYHTGGGATNSAVLFKRLGFTSSSFFKIGSDREGEFIVHELKKEGVSTNHVVHATDVPTASSFIIPTAKGGRIALVFRGANLYLQKHELPTEEITASDQLYITSLSGASSKLLLPITQIAKQHAIPIATNPGTSQLIAGADTLREALPNIDILILNSFEANLFMVSLVQTSKQLHSKVLQTDIRTKKARVPKLLQAPITYESICFSIHQFFQEVLTRGPKIVVVTNGAEGVYVAANNQILFHPSLPVDIVNTLGAGDAFGSCFVGSLVHGHSVEEATVHGIINSTSVISYLDTKTGLLTKEQLAMKMQEIGTDLIQVFSLQE